MRWSDGLVESGVRFGLRNEYWMVDTTAKAITVLLLGERGYEVVDTYGEGETLQGFALNIGDLC